MILGLLIFSIFMTAILFGLKGLYPAYRKTLSHYGMLYFIISLPLGAIFLASA